MDGEDEPRLGTRTESAGKGGRRSATTGAADLRHRDLRVVGTAGHRSVQASSRCGRTKSSSMTASRFAYLCRQRRSGWRNKTFHFGNEETAPSAMLESIHGVETCRPTWAPAAWTWWTKPLVLHGERIPRYRFLVSSAASSKMSMRWSALVGPETVSDPAAGGVIVLGGFTSFSKGRKWPVNVTADTFVS